MKYGQNPAAEVHDFSGVHVEVYHDTAADAAYLTRLDASGALYLGR